ncbi:hypothetical protein HMPREF0889_0314 [Megasphaera lornae]|uniref:Uncharacterized protein n=1 Tax=Megasphaera lornae TaxID=1000568 RepID=D3LVJ0_9FIRM|nr:hypothetical protein [Megasphaera genomosp. type_1]EFD93917.1 hypothetical protein HMPREF0889_0314 [Megasphaera genomosp. type_1 str. 28L]
MNKKIREKLSDPGLAKKLAKETKKLEKELYLKDLKFAADILDIPIDEEGNTTCTEGEQLRFLVLMYGILQHQTAILESAKNSIFAEIKEMDSKVAEDLIDLNDLKLS